MQDDLIHESNLAESPEVGNVVDVSPEKPDAPGERQRFIAFFKTLKSWLKPISSSAGFLVRNYHKLNQRYANAKVEQQEAIADQEHHEAVKRTEQIALLAEKKDQEKAKNTKRIFDLINSIDLKDPKAPLEFDVLAEQYPKLREPIERWKQKIQWLQLNRGFNIEISDSAGNDEKLLDDFESDKPTE